MYVCVCVCVHTCVCGACVCVQCVCVCACVARVRCVQCVCVRAHVHAHMCLNPCASYSMYKYMHVCMRVIQRASYGVHVKMYASLSPTPAQ